MTNSFVNLKNKFWFRLFLKIGLIFLVFVLLLTLCNTVFLKSYYEYVNESDLKTASYDLKNVDVNSKNDVVDIITAIEEEYGFETEVYLNSGKTIYSSSGGQLMDYFLQGNDKLFMNHRPLKSIESKTLSDGSVLERAVDVVTENKYLVYRFSISNSFIGELRVQMAQIENSARIANKFISIIAAIFLFISLLWVFAFSKKISEPISRMNEITGNMAALDFTKKLSVESNDEIGQLAVSINNLSEKLDNTLQDLNESNAKLRSEIELEHQLDKMRKGVYLKELETTTRPCEVMMVGEYTFRIVLTQGLNRQIRRMCKTFGYQVTKLKRVRVMNILLKDLKEGEWRRITGDELDELNRLSNMSVGEK